MKFKGIELKGEFELKCYDDCFEIYQYGNKVYYEDSDDFWYKREYDNNGNEVYYENSDGVIHDNRKKVTIELTQKQLDKIKHLL